MQYDPYQSNFITVPVRDTTEGNVVSRVCQSVHRGETGKIQSLNAADGVTLAVFFHIVILLFDDILR